MDKKLMTVRKFLGLFGRGDFDKAEKLMHPRAVVRWPNTRDEFRGRDKFIEANRRYPGRWKAGIVSINPCGTGVVSVARIRSGDGRASFHAVSFFEFRVGLIARITEYWGEDGEPPAWRKKGGWARRY
jgi:ketosteroid isomerase-like protein